MSSSVHAPDAKFVSRYDQRVTFVQDVLREKSTLGEGATHELAVHVVYAIDHIPEPQR